VVASTAAGRRPLPLALVWSSEDLPVPAVVRCRERREAVPHLHREDRCGRSHGELYEVEREWVRTFWSALAPHAVDVGSYVNFMTKPEEGRVRAAYGQQKYERLAQIKAEYDPDNVLHLNGNVRPAATTHLTAAS
jgi:hypothetical protein